VPKLPQTGDARVVGNSRGDDITCPVSLVVSSPVKVVVEALEVAVSINVKLDFKRSARRALLF